MGFSMETLNNSAENMGFSRNRSHKTVFYFLSISLSAIGFYFFGKKIINLYEIDDLCAKRIISLLPESEKNIEIRVNGALTGYGELVEVDDKLGVEIHSWLSGNNNVK